MASADQPHRLRRIIPRVLRLFPSLPQHRDRLLTFIAVLWLAMFISTDFGQIQELVLKNRWHWENPVIVQVSVPVFAWVCGHLIRIFTRPDFVAADLLSQAEHGIDSQVVLLAYVEKIIEDVLKSIENQLLILPRADISRRALENSIAIIVKNDDEAMAISNEYAPEHLILCTENADDLADMVTNAGSVFIGHFSPESVGDYASGTNHTLPTNGYAKAYSGVSVDSFVKKITYQKLSTEGLKNIGAAVITMAEAEQLDAHAKAVSIRLATL